MSSQLRFTLLDHIRPTAREVFRTFLRTIENEPLPWLAQIYKVPHPDRLISSKVPRPPNSFVLFKSWISKAFGRKDASIAGELWGELKLSNSWVVPNFEILQDEAREAHREVFPNYKFSRLQKKSRGNKVADMAGQPSDERPGSSSQGVGIDAGRPIQFEWDSNADPHPTYHGIVQSASQATTSHDNFSLNPNPAANPYASSSTTAWPQAAFNAGIYNAEGIQESGLFNPTTFNTQYGASPGAQEISSLYSSGPSSSTDSSSASEEEETVTTPYSPVDFMELSSWLDPNAVVEVPDFTHYLGQPLWDVNAGNTEIYSRSGSDYLDLFDADADYTTKDYNF